VNHPIFIESTTPISRLISHATEAVDDTAMFAAEVGGGISPKIILGIVIAALFIGVIILTVSVAVRLS
jgi:hypothetical protein